MTRTPPKRRSNQRRAPRPDQRSAADVWNTPEPLPELQPIEPAADPGALMRSLGTPPLPGDADVSGYFVSVVERSAAIAAAIAQSVDLLAKQPD